MTRFEGFLYSAILAVLFALVIAGFMAIATSRTQYQFTETFYHRVQAGDVLWTIAVENSNGSHDTRTVVNLIRYLSDIPTGRHIQPGDLLVIPVFDNLSP